MFKHTQRLLSYRKLVSADFGKESETTLHKFVSALQIKTAKRELYYFDNNVSETIPGFEKEPQETDQYSDYLNIITNRDEAATLRKLQKLRMEQVFSPAYCMRMALDFKGKMFTSPKEAFDKQTSKYVPHMPVRHLDRSWVNLETRLKDKISIIMIKPNVTSAHEWSLTWFKTEDPKVNMLTNPKAFEKYNEDFMERMSKENKLRNNPKINKFKPNKSQNSAVQSGNAVLPLQLIHLNSINSFLQKSLNVVMQRNLFKSMPKEYQENAFTYNIRDDLSFSMKYNMNLFNPYSPVILVVDQDMKIRWTASGAASSDAERELLWSVVEKLRSNK